MTSRRCCCDGVEPPPPPPPDNIMGVFTLAGIVTPECGCWASCDSLMANLYGIPYGLRHNFASGVSTPATTACGWCNYINRSGLFFNDPEQGAMRWDVDFDITNTGIGSMTFTGQGVVPADFEPAEYWAHRVYNYFLANPVALTGSGGAEPGKLFDCRADNATGEAWWIEEIVAGLGAPCDNPVEPCAKGLGSPYTCWDTESLASGTLETDQDWYAQGPFGGSQLMLLEGLYTLPWGIPGDPPVYGPETSCTSWYGEFTQLAEIKQIRIAYGFLGLSPPRRLIISVTSPGGSIQEFSLNQYDPPFCKDEYYVVCGGWHGSWDISYELEGVTYTGTFTW